MHIDVHTAAVLVRAAAGLFALIGVWRFILIPTLTDHFRQNMFELRRELFCYMASGGVNADEPAYAHLRRSMNGMIRYAEHVSFSRMIVTFAANRQAGRISSSYTG